MKGIYKKNNNKTLRRFLLLSVCLLVIGNVSAFYIFGYNKTIGLTTMATSGGFSVTTEISDIVLSVNESLSSSQQLVIDNSNGLLPMDYTLTIEEENLDPGACDETGDWGYTLSRGGSTIPEGSFNMTSGINTFQFEVNATSSLVCPSAQNITIDFSE